MSNNECTAKREMTFEEDLVYYKKAVKESLDNWHEQHYDCSEDPWFIWRLRDSQRVLKKAEVEIGSLKKEIATLNSDRLSVAQIQEVLDNIIKPKVKEKVLEDYKKLVYTFRILVDNSEFSSTDKQKVINFLRTSLQLIQDQDVKSIKTEIIEEFSAAAVNALSANYSSEYCHWIDDTIDALKKERIDES